MADRWLANARGAHTRALGRPQDFPLFGDGDHTRRLLADLTGEAAATYDDSYAGPALATARYRDWLRAKARGPVAVEISASATGAPYDPPPLSLAPEEPGAVQTRVALAPGRVRAAYAGAEENLERARAILAALTEEFGALFPEEFAAAVKFLEES